MGLITYRCPRCRSVLPIEADALLPGTVPLCRCLRGAPVLMTRLFDCDGYRLWVVTSWE